MLVIFLQIYGKLGKRRCHLQSATVGNSSVLDVGIKRNIHIMKIYPRYFNCEIEQVHRAKGT